MERTLAYLHAPPTDFPSVSLPYSVPRTVVYRNGQLELDNGNCNSTKQLLYFAGERPARTANCKVNEVEVPKVVGSTISQANARLAAQPLTPQYVYEPAKPLQKLGVVVRQFPARGTLSSYDKVTLVLPKALQGAVPKRGRPAARPRQGAARTAPPEVEGRRRAAGRGEGDRTDAALGRGGQARPRRHARRKARLRKREPASA